MNYPSLAAFMVALRLGPSVWIDDLPSIGRPEQVLHVSLLVR